MIRAITREFFQQAISFNGVEDLVKTVHHNEGTPNQRIIQDLTYLIDELKKSASNLDKLNRKFDFLVLNNNKQIEAIIESKSEEETTSIITSASQQEKENLYMFCVLVSKAIAQHVIYQIDEINKHEPLEDNPDEVPVSH